MLIASAGVNWSGPTQTPTTTTRENSGAPSMMLSITPGTPTHSKITGCLGRGADLVGRAPQVPPADRQTAELLDGADGELERRGDVVEVARSPRRGVRRVVSRVDDDVGAAALGELAAPGREVARDDRPHALGLEHQDHAEADRPAADHDRHLLLADLAAAHGVPGDGHRLGQRRDLGRQAVRAPATSATPRRAAARRRRRARGPRARWRRRRRRCAAAAARRPACRSAPPLRLRPVLGDLAAELVAEHDRLRRSARSGRSRPERAMSAHSSKPCRACRSEPQIPQRSDCQADLPLRRRRLGQILDARARRSGRRRPSRRRSSHPCEWPAAGEPAAGRRR